MLEFLKDVDGFVGPALLIIIGGIFKVWQTQINDRREARKLAMEKAIKDEEQRVADRKEAERRARELAADAEHKAKDERERLERAAKEDREKLERELERERQDRQRENDLRQKSMDDMIHHLRGKMQQYESLQGVHERQLKLLEEQKDMLEELVRARDETIARLRQRLQRHEPLGDE